ncbi:MAG: hypothetical protein ABIJ56_02600 [Pseudomonadota bacterium]
MLISMLILLLAGCNGGGSRGDIGEACGEDGDCLADYLCLLPLPGGYCSLDCEPESCTPGSRCVELNGLMRCMKLCAASADCRTGEGYVCNHGVCDIPCEESGECLDFERCGDDGVCVERDDLEPGRRCEKDDHCASGWCLSEEQGSLCSMPCSKQEDCDPFAMVCSAVADPDGGEGLVTACLPPVGDGEAGEPCARHEECRTGICAFGSCTVLCEDGCGAGHECLGATLAFDGKETGLNVCVGIVENGVRTMDYEDVEIPEPWGAGFEVEVRRGDVAFMVFVDGERNDTYYALGSLEAPDGTVLLDEELRGVNMVMPTKKNFTALVPNTDLAEGGIRIGTYTLTVIAIDASARVVDSRADVKILIKSREEDMLDQGAMDLHVFIADGAKEGVSAANAASDPEIAAAMERLGTYYTAIAGIDVGTVGWYDIDARYAVIDDAAELDAMFSLSSMAEGDGPAVFFTASLTGMGEGGLAGYSGGIPGPPDIRGKPRCGVAVVLGGTQRLTADTAAHELGHYLGLFHTSEYASEAVGELHDAISDTDECVLRTPEDYAACEAKSNIMFPAITGLQDELSPGQGFVIRGNAVVK